MLPRDLEMPLAFGLLRLARRYNVLCVCVCGCGCVCLLMCARVSGSWIAVSLSLLRARSLSPPFPPSLLPTLPHAPYLPPASSIDMYNNDVGQKSAINL